MNERIQERMVDSLASRGDEGRVYPRKSPRELVGSFELGIPE